MGKKKEAKKSLQKRVIAIIDLYTGKKSKRKKNLLKGFIDIKVKEIIEFSEQLKKRKKKNETPPGETIVINETPNIQRSHEWGAVLQNNPIVKPVKINVKNTG